MGGWAKLGYKSDGATRIISSFNTYSYRQLRHDIAKLHRCRCALRECAGKYLELNSILTGGLPHRKFRRWFVIPTHGRALHQEARRDQQRFQR